MDNQENSANLTAALECLLFLAEEPLPDEELTRMLETTPAQTQEVIRELAAQYEGRGLQLAKIAGGWQLCTRPEYAPFIARMHEPEKVRMSRAALETLAIIAYRQPITRPEIEAVRGVNVDGVIVRLLEYGLIEEQGRKEAPGRPMLYGTTEDFLVHFGLDSVKDLPQLPEVDEAAVEVVAALPEEVEPPLTEGASVQEPRAEDSPVEEAATEEAATEEAVAEETTASE